jgi:hypothetical protein
MSIALPSAMPDLKRFRARDCMNAGRIRIEAAASFKTALLRLAEALAREGLALRPLELYGAIVNEDFAGVTPIAADAVVFAVLHPAVRRLSVSLALAERALRVGERPDVRLLALVAGPPGESESCRQLHEELADLLGPEERRAALRGARTPAEAWRLLKGAWKA